MAEFDQFENERQGGGFMMGLLCGAVLGAGIGMLLAPRAGTELRGTIGSRARTLGNAASQQYRRAAESASGWAEKGREYVDKARERVSRGAEEYTGTTTGTTTGSTFGGTEYGRS